MTVQELFDSVLQAIDGKPQTGDFLSTVNVALDIVTNALWKARSDFLKSDSRIAFTAGDDTENAPTGFLGWVESPFYVQTAGGVLADISTLSPTRLQPLPAMTDAACLKSDLPRYYEMRGNTVKLYPVPSVAVLVVGKSYTRPSVSAMSSTIPYGGYFDNILADIVIQVSQQGAFVTANPAFAQTFESQIVKQLHLRAPKRAYFRR